MLRDGVGRLLTMGLVTNLLNPKIAVLYLSLLPQFIHPGHGSVLRQSLILGITQIGVSISVNSLIVFMAGGIAAFLSSRPPWGGVHRWLLGDVLAGLPGPLATD